MGEREQGKEEGGGKLVLCGRGRGPRRVLACVPT